MKILLLGGSGQLGYEIRARAHDLNFEVIAPVSSEVDVGNFEQVRFLSKQLMPDIIINCAAYTAVDKAETERERCFHINRDGAGNAAKAAAEIHRRLIHVSTDHVFSGTGNTPLTEEDAAGPLNVYGESKLAGERQVMSALPDKALILRSASLHGQRGTNFVNTMLSLFRTRETVQVVNDQVMSPTWAGWLAEVILDLARVEASGVLHASGEGSCSWFEFACAIREWANGPFVASVEPISTAAFGRPAKRPRYSAFNCAKLAGLLGRRPISWQDGLKAHLKEMGVLRNDV